MKKKTLLAAVIGAVLAVGLVHDSSAWTPRVVRDEPVNIILRNGDKIRATILDIWRDKVVFKASNWRDAYEYGEVIGVGQIAAIELKDGRRLSVAEYDDYRKGQLPEQQKAKEEQPATRPSPAETRIADRAVVTRTPQKAPTNAEIDQYELLKRKPISEMTDREFEFFMMMKRRELEEQRLREQLELERERRALAGEKVAAEEAPAAAEEPDERSATVPVRPRRGTVSPPSSSRFGLRLPSLRGGGEDLEAAKDMAGLLIAADLAGPFLLFASQQGGSLTPFQQQVVEEIEASPKWQERVENIEFLTRTASRALERVFLYEPESLRKLGLAFDENANLDADDLLGQLHGKLGNDVQMGDFRILVDVLGEGGARAVRDLMRNYETYEYVKAAGGVVARK